MDGLLRRNGFDLAQMRWRRCKRRPNFRRLYVRICYLCRRRALLCRRLIAYRICVSGQGRLSQRGENAEEDRSETNPRIAMDVRRERSHKRVGKARGAGTTVADSELARRPYNYYKRAVAVNLALRYGDDELARRFEGAGSIPPDGGVGVGEGVGLGVGEGAAAACVWYASQAGRWLKSRRRKP